ncbi:hypothetical protein FJW04_09580 [Mesorhizobium sp. B2-7-3]|uniref:hypothetical protein n=1 Tax=Mesorhizobium sp. B2-7-3 TaxID=2589907 RepID=UPI00112D1C82|nr:hypothetical protein [Mesorhizobium sp. B2-7-3]TPJ17783.1 hypothetical protein FJW04_09580 [Mesorhizobium sp. B2-7-3]
MPVNISISDRSMIAKNVADMGDAERELLRRRAHETADAIEGALSPEFGRLVTLALLERGGATDEGAVERYLKSIKVNEKPVNSKSAYAQKGASRSAF